MRCRRPAGPRSGDTPAACLRVPSSCRGRAAVGREAAGVVRLQRLAGGNRLGRRAAARAGRAPRRSLGWRERRRCRRAERERPARRRRSARGAEGGVRMRFTPWVAGDGPECMQSGRRMWSNDGAPSIACPQFAGTLDSHADKTGPHPLALAAWRRRTERAGDGRPHRLEPARGVRGLPARTRRRAPRQVRGAGGCAHGTRRRGGAAAAARHAGPAARAGDAGGRSDRRRPDRPACCRPEAPQAGREPQGPDRPATRAATAQRRHLRRARGAVASRRDALGGSAHREQCAGNDRAARRAARRSRGAGAPAARGAGARRASRRSSCARNTSASPRWPRPCCCWRWRGALWLARQWARPLRAVQEATARIAQRRTRRARADRARRRDRRRGAQRQRHGRKPAAHRGRAPALACRPVARTAHAADGAARRDRGAGRRRAPAQRRRHAVAARRRAAPRACWSTTCICSRWPTCRRCRATSPTWMPCRSCAA